MIRILVGILATALLASFCPPQDVCLVNGTANAALCAKPATGCLCWFSAYTLHITSGVDCQPCDYDFTCTFECTTGSIETKAFNGDLACGNAVLLGWRCPCTGIYFYPVQVTCAACQ